MKSFFFHMHRHTHTHITTILYTFHIGIHIHAIRSFPCDTFALYDLFKITYIIFIYAHILFFRVFMRQIKHPIAHIICKIFAICTVCCCCCCWINYIYIMLNMTVFQPFNASFRKVVYVIYSSFSPSFFPPPLPWYMNTPANNKTKEVSINI